MIGGGAPQIPTSQTPRVCPICGQVTTPPPPGPQHGLHIVPGTAGQQRRCIDCGHIFTRAALGAAPLTPVLSSAPQNPQPQRPRYNAANVPHAQRLSVVTGKRVHGKLYEVFMFEIAGILSLFIPPIFGLPSLTYLAVALMTFIPLYSVLPSESQVVASLGGGRITREAGDQIGFLILKSISKIIAFSFIIFQFYVSFFAFRLLSVAIAFLFYFSLPMHYRTSQPSKMIEAWFRMGLGGYISFILMLTFGGMGPGSNLGTIFGSFGLAFFLTFPVHIPDQEGGVININFLNHETTQRGFQIFDRIWFSVFMVIALVGFLSMTGGGWGIDRIMFYAFFGLSFFAGLSTGPEGKPALGIVMIFILMFVLTSSYPGYVGNAVFGYWWPQIQSFGDTYMGPLNDAWATAQRGLSDSWEMMTCPQCYYQKQLLKQQATKSVIMTGGTPMSIEISKFELIPSMPGTLEPNEPTIGNMELHNQGQFTSGKIDLEIWTTRVNATELKEYADAGIVNNLYCTRSSSPQPSSSSGLGKPASCQWQVQTYPTEMRSITFKLQEGSSGWDGAGANIATGCQDNSNKSNPTGCTCFTWGAGGCPVGNTTYKYSGTSVKVNANLTYTYVVNVSLPITIINSTVYLNKLAAGDITLQDFTSEYTGGPVKATIFTPKQPARTDVPFLFVASIYNDGSGELVNITNFTITVYNGDAIDHVEVIGTDFRTGNTWPPTNPKPNGCDSSVGSVPGNLKNDTEGNFYINCNHDITDSSGVSQDIIKPGEWKRISFYIHPSNNIGNQKTVQIIGWAEYTYRKTTSQTLTVANAPPQ